VWCWLHSCFSDEREQKMRTAALMAIVLVVGFAAWIAYRKVTNPGGLGACNCQQAWPYGRQG